MKMHLDDEVIQEEKTRNALYSVPPGRPLSGRPALSVGLSSTLRLRTIRKQYRGKLDRESGQSGRTLLLADEIERCRREIDAVESALQAGHSDVAGLCLALDDGSAELRMLQNEQRRQE